MWRFNPFIYISFISYYPSCQISFSLFKKSNGSDSVWTLILFNTDLTWPTNESTHNCLRLHIRLHLLQFFLFFAKVRICQLGIILRTCKQGIIKLCFTLYLNTKGSISRLINVALETPMGFLCINVCLPFLWNQ